MKIYNIICLLYIFSSIIPVICDENKTTIDLIEDINIIDTINNIPFIVKFWLFTEIILIFQ